MGKVVPFKQRPLSSEEDALLQQIRETPENIKPLIHLFLLRIEKGKFNLKDNYTIRLADLIVSSNTATINNFLLLITPLIGNITAGDNTFEDDLLADVQLIKEIQDNCDATRLQITNAKNDVSLHYFQGDDFIEKVKNIFSIKETIGSFRWLGKTGRNDFMLRSFMSTLLDRILSIHGLTEGAIYIALFSRYPTLKQDSKKDLTKFISKYNIQFKKDDFGYTCIQIIERYLTVNLSQLSSCQ